MNGSRNGKRRDAWMLGSKAGSMEGKVDLFRKLCIMSILFVSELGLTIVR